MKEIEQNPVHTNTNVADLERFQIGIHNLLHQMSLPINDLFTSIEERRIAVNNLPTVVNELPDEVQKTFPVYFKNGRSHISWII